MARKRICFVITLAKSYREFLLGLSRYLIEHHNYDVTFICTDDGKIGEVCNEHLHFIPVKMKRGVGFDAPRVIWQLYRIFRREKFDVVQYCIINASFCASIAAALAGIRKRIYCIWGLRYVGFTGLKKALIKSAIKGICKRSTHIEVESFSVLDLCIKDKLFEPGKASVIWNGSATGVDMKKFDYSKREHWREVIRSKYNISPDTMVFGYAGRITRDKGINELVDSFMSIPADNNALLLLVGDYDTGSNPLRSDVVNTIETSNRIIHAPYTSELEKYYAAMDVFCSLSYREGFGLVVVEAGAVGTPGIVSDALGQIDTVEDGVTGFITKVKDIESIKRAFTTCLENPMKVRDMGVNAFKSVKELYDDRILLEKLAEHRNKIIAE